MDMVASEEERERIAQEVPGGLSFRNVAMTKGDNYPDALVVAPYLARSGGTLLLTRTNVLPTQIRDTLVRYGPEIFTLDFVGLGPSIQPVVKGLLP